MPLVRCKSWLPQWVSCPTVLPRLISGAALCCQQSSTVATKWLGLAPSPGSPSSSASDKCWSLSLHFLVCEMATMASSQWHYGLSRWRHPAQPQAWVKPHQRHFPNSPTGLRTTQHPGGGEGGVLLIHGAPWVTTEAHRLPVDKGGKEVSLSWRFPQFGGSQGGLYKPGVP